MNINKASSRGVLFQILILFLVIAALVLMQRNTLQELYSFDESSRLGLVLNGIIIGLFFLGLIRIVIVLLEYAREQKVLLHLVENLREGRPRVTTGLPEKSMAVRRYDQVIWINQQNAPVNQAALAASLNATESSRFTLIRFVHNILILVGVFGTVVSLSIALVGASGLLDSPESMKKMSMIIGGMSTALSTTITAIVCFIIYAYFYLRLNDVKTVLLSSIEDLTSLYILPRVAHNEETLMRDVSKLTVALRQAAERMGEVETRFIQAGETLHHAVADLRLQVNAVNHDMSDLKGLITRGFRLPEANGQRPPHQPYDHDGSLR